MHAPQHANLQAFPRARRPHRVSLLALALALALATSCRASITRLTSTTDGQRAPADQLFSAFINRYTDVRRDAKIESARQKLAHGALIPSRVFNDTAAWTTNPSPTARTLIYRGTSTNAQYRISAVPSPSPAPSPSRPGDTRHVISLTRLTADDYRWDVATDFSLGAPGPSNVASILGGFFASAERRTEPELRADYRTAFPRTTAVVGALYSIDTIRTATHGDGSTSIDVNIGIHPEGIRAKYPSVAAYLKKYTSPGAFSYVLRDRSGATWVIVDARNERLRFQLRSRNGRLVPLNGGARAMPDTLDLESLTSAKIGIFRVGFEKLHSDFIISRDEREPAWTIISRREPQWHLPLFTETLIKSSLRRPFEGSGALVRLSLHDDGGQTLFSRRIQLTVRESTVLRFLGRLGSTAYNDLSTRVEDEFYRYLRDVFVAMREDARALSG